MPAGFDYPNERTRLWVPFPIERNPDGRGSHGVLAIGRLRPGATFASAGDERAVLMTAWASRHRHHVGHGLVLRPLLADLVGDVRLPLLVLAASVALVLLVMAAAVSGLLLAQGESRRRELAVRDALGAGRARLVRQLVCETLLVAGAAGLAGMLLAALSLPAVLVAYPGTLPRASSIAFGGFGIVAMTALSGAIGLLVAVAPAMRLARGALLPALRAGDRGASRSGRSQQALVAVELALAVAVTIAAMLLIETFTRLQAAPLGFDPGAVVAATVSLPVPSAGAEREATAFFTGVIDRLRQHPGIVSAGAMSAVPLVNRPPPDDFFIEGRRTAAPGEPGNNAHYVMATPGALEAIGATLLRGRPIEPSDRDVNAPVALVNERLGELYWPGRDPIGRRIRYPTGIEGGRWTTWTPWITIVGIVGDVRSIAPSQPAQPAIYVSYAQRPRAAYSGATMGVVARAAGDVRAVQTAIRDAARAVDARAVAAPARTLDAMVGTVLARPRFLSGLMSGLAVVAMVIAVIGTYGLVATGVAQRTREIGTRLALGAPHAAIASLVARRLLVTLGAGVPAGLVGAWILARWMAALLYEVRPWEPGVYALVVAGVTTVVCIAVAVPVRRALGVDPLIALRAE
jgi:putative ABC transport system permease protein